MIKTPMRVITFKADEKLIEKIDLIAKRSGRSRSDIIRYAILTYIHAIEGSKKKTIELKNWKIIRKRMFYDVLSKD